MSNSNGIISKPINVISDLAYVLGVNSGDIATLCTSNSHINKWAKYRHMPNYEGPGYILKNGHGDGDNGINIVSHDSFNVFKIDIPISGEPWASFLGIKTTQSGSYYRLLDFDGYNANAESPFASLNAPIEHTLGQKDTEADAGKMRVSLTFNTDAPTGSAGPLDFDIMKSTNLYFGLVFHNAEEVEVAPGRYILVEANHRIISSSSTIRSMMNNGSLPIPIALTYDVPDAFLFADDNWYCYAVLTNKSHPNGVQALDTGEILYSFPLSRKQIKINPAPVTTHVAISGGTASYSSSKAVITVGFTATMYNYSELAESYTIIGVKGDGTTDILKSESKDNTWPTPVGTPNASRTFSGLTMSNQYYMQVGGTSERIYLKYSSIQITYTWGGHTAFYTIENT